MPASADDEFVWEPETYFPAHPEFYRRVLHYMPTALIVVNQDGEIIYVNQAMFTLGGWELSDDAMRNVLEYVHPDDRDALAQAFVEIVESPGARVLGSGRPWAEIYFRIVRADGTTLPIELVGSGGILDPAVGGIIYEVRPAQVQDLLGRVLDGFSKGASMHQLLSTVAEIIAGPPLDMQAVILQSTAEGGMFVTASTSPVLTAIFSRAPEDLPWSDTMREPTYVDLSELPEKLESGLRRAGFVDLWHVSVQSPLTDTSLRIVATSATHHVPATGPKNRLLRARELASAVLLRSQADVLLARAADHDVLTDLPNQAAFHQAAESVNPLLERGALHVDIDALKNVNAEFGPATGDAVLRVAADRMRALCAAADVIGRVSGDEFVVLTTDSGPERSLEDRLLKLAADTLDAITEPVIVAGRSISLRASIGISTAPSGVSTDHLLTWAHSAMHDAKAAGGNQVRRFGVSLG